MRRGNGKLTICNSVSAIVAPQAPADRARSPPTPTVGSRLSWSSSARAWRALAVSARRAAANRSLTMTLLPLIRTIETFPPSYVVRLGQGTPAHLQLHRRSTPPSPLRTHDRDPRLGQSQRPRQCTHRCLDCRLRPRCTDAVLTYVDDISRSAVCDRSSWEK